MTWSHDIPQASKDMLRQLTIILFPLMISATGLDLGKYKKSLLLLFAITCAATILYLYADAMHIIAYYHLPARSLFQPAFMNHNFSEPIGMHATYMSMYVALSIASMLSFFLEEKNKLNRILYIIVLAILIGGLLQLASRSVLIATILFTTGGFPFFISKKIRMNFMLIAGVIALIILLSILNIGSFKKRYVAELKYDLTSSAADNQVSESRISRWNIALNLIKRSPVIGYGSGSEKRLLNEKYFENKLYTSYLLELNAHNQYLSILIKTGEVGLIIFLFILFFGFNAAWRTRDIVFISFMMLISIVSFSENILDVNKGIFFYSFFFSFFIAAGKPFTGLSRLIKKKPKNS